LLKVSSINKIKRVHKETNAEYRNFSACCTKHPKSTQQQSIINNKVLNKLTTKIKHKMKKTLTTNFTPIKSRALKHLYSSKLTLEQIAILAARKKNLTELKAIRNGPPKH
jgi:hypothetical protein